MKTLELSAGKRTRIIRNFSNSIPMSYCFTAESMTKGKNKDISGKVEVRGSNWIFPRQPLVLELNKNNVVKKRAWDSFYSIYVTPDIDTLIVFKRTRFNILTMLIPLLIGVVAIIIVLSMFTWG